MDLIGIMKKEGALSCFSGVFVVLSGVFLFCVVKLGQSSCYEPHLSLATRFLDSPRGAGVAFIIHIPFSVVFGGLINNRTSVVFVPLNKKCRSSRTSRTRGAIDGCDSPCQ